MGKEFDLYVLCWQPTIDLNYWIEHGEVNVNLAKGKMDFVTINWALELSIEEVKSMTIFKLSGLNLAKVRSKWEASTSTTSRLYGDFFEVDRYGMTSELAANIECFETAQLIEATGSSFMLAPDTTLEDLETRWKSRIEAYRASDPSQASAAPAFEEVKNFLKSART